jgi:hypothetical protein
MQQFDAAPMPLAQALAAVTQQAALEPRAKATPSTSH